MPPVQCPLCYYVKWNNSGTSYEQVRPIFPLNKLPPGTPAIDSTLNPGLSACDPLRGDQTTGTCTTGVTNNGKLNFYWWDFNKLSAQDFLKMNDATTVAMPSVNVFYSYSYPYSWSANTGREEADTISMFFLQDDCEKFFHFYILDKAWDGSGGDYRMKLSGTSNLFTANSADPIDFHDGYTWTQTNAVNNYKDAENYPGQASVGTLPIMLRDDPWNKYEYVPAAGAVAAHYNFHWNWLQCCTDGMILGPMPSNQVPHSLTYEGRCGQMKGLESGTRISMWNPYGPAYNPSGAGLPAGCPSPTGSSSINLNNWIHYDVPMDLSCEATKGIQIAAEPCAAHCQTFTNCGECSAQMGCGWSNTINGGSCQSTCVYPSGLTTIEATTDSARTCSSCSSITDPHSCMCEKGCGWAPSLADGSHGVGKCISGTPDYPSDNTVKVVQWETKGCPKDCGTLNHPSGIIPANLASGFTEPSPSGDVINPNCCPRYAPKSMCYRAAYNEKKEYAGIRLTEEFGVHPATAYPATHPKVKFFGGDPKKHLPSLDFWRRYEGHQPVQPQQAYNGSVVFFAYDYPNKHSSNTGYEASDSMVTFMVQGDDCKTYILVLLDNNDNTGGTAHIDMITEGAPCDPIMYRNDPTSLANSMDTENFPTCGNGSVTWTWQPDFNDGMVVGPLPYGVDWSVSMKLEKQSRGLDTFKIGTYDSERNDIGFKTADIRKVTHKWGGLKYDAMECTTWCQRYQNDCSACVKDESCTFSAAHGGCVAADAYIYDYNCARPKDQLETKVLNRDPMSYERESVLDGWDSAQVIRYTLPTSLDLSCPCASRYRICATVYDSSMNPIYRMDCTPPRLDYPHTFVDLPSAGPQPFSGGSNGAVLQQGQTYHIQSFLCIEQGTLGRDDCSPWYQVRTVHDHVVPYYEVVDLASGQKQHQRKTRTEAGVRHALALHLQTEYCPYTPDCGTPGQPVEYYTTVDALVVDGEPHPNHQWDTVTPFPGFNSRHTAVDTLYSGDRYGRMRSYYRNRKSLSLTFGFHTNRTRSCSPTLQDTVNIGIYCSWVPQSGVELDEKQCRFSLTAHLIPEMVYDGFDATYPIAPAGGLGEDDLAPLYVREESDVGQIATPDPASHYFRLRVGGFDVVSVKVTRHGANLTFVDADGTVASNGQGLQGVVVRRRVSEGCPTPSLHDLRVNVTDLTTTVEMPAFCTDAALAGDYRFGVLASAQFGPFYDFLPEASSGKVGPDRLPLTFYRPRREQTAYGAYRLQVRHVAYFDGAMSSGEARPSCLSYGQWRSFHVDTTGEADATIEVAITKPNSGVYVRAGLPSERLPSEAYDVKSPSGALLVTGTPCDVVQPTRWHFSLYLASSEEQDAQVQAAAIRGESAAAAVHPSEFEVQVRLRPAQLGLGTAITPYSDGGRGFVCCGASRYFRVQGLEEAQTLRAVLNVTSGRVHAVMLKWRSCPRIDADVDGLRGQCRGFCAMEWLTTRGEYSGSLYSVPTSGVVVPHGSANAPDKRRAGVWYVGVQAMPGETAEFGLLATAPTPKYVPPSAKCDRTTFLCSSDSARLGWNSSGPPAPPPSLFALAHARASRQDDMNQDRLELIRDAISGDVAQRMATMVLLLLGSVCFCWCYRSWRFKRRLRYRVPDDVPF